jgi:uncharacterized protein
MSDTIARYPYPVGIDAYGNGGFRFAEMSHRGSLLFLPTGVYSWALASAEAASVADFERPLAELSVPAVLLFGAGATQIWPPEAVVRAFADKHIGFESMSTGAAARTYNVLLAEGRAVAAALIAVD